MENIYGTKELETHVAEKSFNQTKTSMIFERAGNMSANAICKGTRIGSTGLFITMGGLMTGFLGAAHANPLAIAAGLSMAKTGGLTIAVGAGLAATGFAESIVVNKAENFVLRNRKFEFGETSVSEDIEKDININICNNSAPTTSNISINYYNQNNDEKIIRNKNVENSEQASTNRSRKFEFGEASISEDVEKDININISNNSAPTTSKISINYYNQNNDERIKRNARENTMMQALSFSA